MRPVTVLILHALPDAAAGPLGRSLAAARGALAARQRAAFLAAGADEARIVAGAPDGRSFGERLRHEAPRRGGLVVLGSGSLPLATARDLRRLVEAAGGPAGTAFTNNRFSADAVAVADAAVLAGLPDLPADNALPRWLAERAGVAVSDLSRRWQLGADLDSPADVLTLAPFRAAPPELRRAARTIEALAPGAAPRIAALRDVLTNRRAELLVAGRLSSATLAWLREGVRCRVRAIVEERGLRAASALALGADGGEPATVAHQRAPRSVLGELLDRDGPEALGPLVSRLADAAVLDTRVLLAHRCGAGEAAWPPSEDRFASDLLLAGAIADPWLRALTGSAVEAPPPILLGGHTLLNAGLRVIAHRTAR